MKNKKIITFLVLLVFLIGGIFLINNINQNKNKINKTKRRKQNNLAIMIKEKGATEYTASSSKDIPKGNYTLNYEKSYCKNNGVIGNYDNTLGKVSFSFIGTDSCYLYFDYGLPGYITILNNNGGKDAIEAKGTPDFSQIVDTNEGMYAAKDDLGTSYYFRGAVDNNWLQYGEYIKDMYNCNNGILSETDTGNSCTKIASKGDKMYWRVVRINGDASIRLIYSGITAPTEDTKVTMTQNNTLLGNSLFNTNRNNAEYVGYMYTIGEQHGTSVDSTIKKFLENWYANYTNLNNKEMKTTDTIYCNDRMASSSSGKIPEEISLWVSSGTPYYYGAQSRINSPVLTCTNVNDKFSTTISYGNGKLFYSVGLITSDEVMMAGAASNNNENYNFYLNNGAWYWTSSPGNFDSYNNANVYVFSEFGDLDARYTNENDNAARPVISLSPSVKLSGSGTWNDVYTVS